MEVVMMMMTTRHCVHKTKEAQAISLPQAQPDAEGSRCSLSYSCCARDEAGPPRTLGHSLLGGGLANAQLRSYDEKAKYGERDRELGKAFVQLSASTWTLHCRTARVEGVLERIRYCAACSVAILYWSPNGTIFAHPVQRNRNDG
eukprot:626818-Karenia_brevis.AAC.1